MLHVRPIMVQSRSWSYFDKAYTNDKQGVFYSGVGIGISALPCSSRTSQSPALAASHEINSARHSAQICSKALPNS
jgi:hypothetical protein